MDTKIINTRDAFQASPLSTRPITPVKKYYINPPRKIAERASTSDLKLSSTKISASSKIRPIGKPNNQAGSFVLEFTPKHLTSRPRSTLRRPASRARLQSESMDNQEISSPIKRPETSLGHTSLLSHEYSTESLVGSGNVRVLVRARPFLPRELERGSRCILAMNPITHSTILYPQDSDNSDMPTSANKRLREAKEFVFDESIWSVDSSDDHYVDQEGMYGKVAKDLLGHSLEGYHTCLIAYGQTGSGKSFTMIGSDENPGIIPRMCYDLFQRIKDLTTGTTTFTVKVSYFEIYNEQVFDLLTSTNGEKTPQALKVRESPVDGPYVKDLVSHPVRSFEDVERYLRKGNRVRATASTNMNSQSSRSHAVFTLVLKKVQFDQILDETEETNSRIRFVDLAGSERANSTGATGTRLREGANINKSLTTLGRVISVLADSAITSKRKDVVPYRDSTLTWLLKDSLGGNSKTTMIACLSPGDYEETLSTLRYASQAKHIKTRAIVNQDFISAKERDRKLEELQETITKLQDALTRNSTDHKQQTDAHSHEIEKFRKVIKYYEDNSEVAEARARALMQENETIKCHNRLITDHLKELKVDMRDSEIPFSWYSEFRSLLDDTSTFRDQLSNDIKAMSKLKLMVNTNISAVY
ncbi:P-loop containing nucleoside triphosphate hydrolase protein [Dipodascopsis uninucleata]